ncbi:MAG: hypothetical protein FRX48_08413 [Lasallia pustulata]|uniref:Uncharacterized protein n=1 Tax=Lasallia pustulata TaxID=136370 RepID=A0A1W5DDE7_9LECA|nr:MAG: hypothetical protein FRX48_08413 [Lasallia pustulata]SLM41071.1 hypothetical protein LPUS_11972 [Lasallia pustulata]
MMANLQSMTHAFASGPVDPANNQYTTHPIIPEEAAMCLTQRVRYTSATCFSVLGLAIILVFRKVFIAIDLALAPLVRWVQKDTRKGVYARREWIHGETL